MNASCSKSSRRAVSLVILRTNCSNESRIEGSSKYIPSSFFTLFSNSLGPFRTPGSAGFAPVPTLCSLSTTTIRVSPFGGNSYKYGRDKPRRQDDGEGGNLPTFTTNQRA